MAKTDGLSTEDLALFAKYDTPTVCNVIELFEIRPCNTGYMDGRIVCNFPQLTPMVGYACTSTFRADASPSAKDTYASVDDQIDQFARLPGPAVLVFQDLDDPPVAATFGEVMCTSYKAFGAIGLITSGAGRDLDQVEQLGFPTFTGSAICAHGYCHIPSVGEPVRVGGLMVNPGDLLHGDRNGVTNIPHEIASEAASICAEFVKAEEVVLDYLRAGSVTPRGRDQAKAECKERIDALRAQVRKKQ